MGTPPGTSYKQRGVDIIEAVSEQTGPRGGGGGNSGQIGIYRAITLGGYNPFLGIFFPGPPFPTTAVRTSLSPHLELEPIMFSRSLADPRSLTVGARRRAEHKELIVVLNVMYLFLFGSFFSFSFPTLVFHLQGGTGEPGYQA